MDHAGSAAGSQWARAINRAGHEHGGGSSGFPLRWGSLQIWPIQHSRQATY
jgi:hypothetical protein